MSFRFYTLLFFIFLLSSNCASTYFKSRFEQYGEYNPTSPLHPKVLSLENPKVFVEGAPDGIKIEDDRIMLDTDQYEILGRIDVVRNFETFDLGFFEFNEKWRDYYCPPVSILTCATLFTLVIIPLPWPCIYERSSSIERIEERKNNMMNVLIMKAKEVGATHVVYTRFLHKKQYQAAGVIIPIGNNFAVASGSATEKEQPYTGMSGIALRIK